MTHTRKTTTTSYTIANLAGGDLRRFRLVDGELSGRSIRHADGIGYGGPVFGGPAGDVAAELYAQILRDREDAQ